MSRSGFIETCALSSAIASAHRRAMISATAWSSIADACSSASRAA